MSEAPKSQEPATNQAGSSTNVPDIEVDKSIPEPVVGQPAAPEQPPAAAAAATTTSTDSAINFTEETSNVTGADKSKEKDSSEKPEDLARSLLRGFQYRIAGVFPKKSEKTSDTKDEKKDDSDAKDDDKETKDRRSASRKRNSLFGGFGLGKKEEKTAPEEPSSPETNKDQHQESVNSIDPVPEPARVSESGVNAECSSERPGPAKRASIFGTLKNQFAKKDKTDSTVSAVKEAEPVTNTAPVIPAVGTVDYIGSGTSAKGATDQAQEPAATDESKTEKTVTKAEKRKSSLPFGLGSSKKDKSQTDEDAPEKVNEKPLSPFAKFRATVKSKTSPRHPGDKKDDVTTVPEASNEQQTDKPIVSEPESAVTSPCPAVAASA